MPIYPDFSKAADCYLALWGSSCPAGGDGPGGTRQRKGGRKLYINPPGRRNAQRGGGNYWGQGKIFSPKKNFGRGGLEGVAVVGICPGQKKKFFQPGNQGTGARGGRPARGPCPPGGQGGEKTGDKKQGPKGGQSSSKKKGDVGEGRRAGARHRKKLSNPFLRMVFPEEGPAPSRAF